jgi:hypothetical protein
MCTVVWPRIPLLLSHLGVCPYPWTDRERRSTVALQTPWPVVAAKGRPIPFRTDAVPAFASKCRELMYLIPSFFIVWLRSVEIYKIVVNIVYVTIINYYNKFMVLYYSIDLIHQILIRLSRKSNSRYRMYSREIQRSNSLTIHYLSMYLYDTVSLHRPSAHC